MIHLDTSFLIRALIQDSPQDHMLRKWIRAAEPLGMSAIAWGEFLCGPADDRQVGFARAVILERTAFNDEHATTASKLFNESGRRRGTLIDCMIAATALGSDATLATENVADFHRFESAGLQVIQAGVEGG